MSNNYKQQALFSQLESDKAFVSAEEPVPGAHFNGPEYDPARDKKRLQRQIGRVFHVMRDEQWRTLDEISEATRSHTEHGNADPVASVSAQLRHLRKPRFGGHTVNRKHITSGLFRYQLVPNQTRP